MNSNAAEATRSICLEYGGNDFKVIKCQNQFARFTFSPAN